MLKPALLLRLKISLYGLTLPLLRPLMSIRAPALLSYTFIISDILVNFSAVSTQKLWYTPSLPVDVMTVTASHMNSLQASANSKCMRLSHLLLPQVFATLPLLSSYYIGCRSDKALPVSCYRSYLKLFINWLLPTFQTVSQSHNLHGRYNLRSTNTGICLTYPRLK